MLINGGTALLHTEGGYCYVGGGECRFRGVLCSSVFSFEAGEVEEVCIKEFMEDPEAQIKCLPDMSMCPRAINPEIEDLWEEVYDMSAVSLDFRPHRGNC